MKKIYFYLIIISLSTAICKAGNTMPAAQPVMIPDSALFAKEHPFPAIVRGFMVSENIKQQDCDDLRAWGANVIRLQMAPARYATRMNKDV